MCKTYAIIPVTFALCLLLTTVNPVFSKIYIAKSGSELQDALYRVNPGDQIELRKPGRDVLGYPFLYGNFDANVSGTVEKPIVIFGKTKEVGLISNEFGTVLSLRASHLKLKRFSITSLPEDHGFGLTGNGPEVHNIVVDNLEIKAKYGVYTYGISDILIRNSKIISSYSGVFSTGSSDSPSGPARRNHIVNNTFVHDGSDYSYARAIHYGGDSICCSTIQNNIFLSTGTQGSWEYWVDTTGFDLLIRNNTGTVASLAGFRVAKNQYKESGERNIFQANSCGNVTIGYCISVNRDSANSTCITADNTYKSAYGLSNTFKICDKVIYDMDQPVEDNSEDEEQPDDHDDETTTTTKTPPITRRTRPTAHRPYAFHHHQPQYLFDTAFAQAIHGEITH